MEDLLQEGMIGLYKAIRDYDPSYGVSFDYFAKLCTVRQIQSAVKTSLRQHQKALNDAYSYDQEAYDGEEDSSSLVEMIEDKSQNPEEVLMAQEEGDLLFSSLEKDLSPMEKRVLEVYREKFDYQEVAKELNITPKAADNALQRIRRKAKKYWE